MSDTDSAADALAAKADRAAIDVVEVVRAIAPYGLVAGCLWATLQPGLNDTTKHVVDLILGAAILAINPRGRTQNP